MGMGSPGLGVGSLTLGMGSSCGRAGSAIGSWAGVSGFGIGSNIVNKKLIAAGDFAAITELARAFLASLGSAGEAAK